MFSRRQNKLETNYLKIIITAIKDNAKKVIFYIIFFSTFRDVIDK